MTNTEEQKYAALMAKAYNWLDEYRLDGHDAFSFCVSQRGNYLLQGRGSPNERPSYFYVEIGKRIDNYTYFALDFYVVDDFSRICKVNCHIGWINENDSYKTFAGNFTGVANRKSVTLSIVESEDENAVKDGLCGWLHENYQRIQAAYGQDRRPSDETREDRVNELVVKGLLSRDAKGCVSIPPTAVFTDPDIGQDKGVQSEMKDQKDNDDKGTDNGEGIVVKGPRNRLVFGAPGTGKSHLLEKERVDFGENFERVTFYPTYSYAQFVGTYKPVMRGEGADEAIAYEFVPGPFLRVLVKALNEVPDADGKKNDWCLIIEEINRANAAAVFGDVFQLLDRGSNGVSEYAVSASEDVKKYLAQNLTDAGKQALTALSGSAESLKIPANMYLWATMNSADQGVFPLDTAFKRRWEFEYIGINDGVTNVCKSWMLGGHDYKWNDVRQFINGALSAYGVNEDKLMGPYFITAPQGSLVISEKSFLSKVLMYLWEDAGRMIRAKLFGSGIKTYSGLLEKWENDGLAVFAGLVAGDKLDEKSKAIYERLTKSVEADEEG